MEEKLKGMSISKIESNDMIRPKEMKIEEKLDAVRSLKNKQSCLENEISEMRLIMDNKIAGLEEEAILINRSNIFSDKRSKRTILRNKTQE